MKNFSFLFAEYYQLIMSLVLNVITGLNYSCKHHSVILASFTITNTDFLKLQPVWKFNFQVFNALPHVIVQYFLTIIIVSS